jgi:hypothetical protein
MVGLLGCFWPGNMLPSEEMLADADFAQYAKESQGHIQCSRSNTAVAAAYGFPSSEPEPQALPSCHDGLARLGFFGLGLSQLAALGQAMHITSLSSLKWWCLATILGEPCW